MVALRMAVEQPEKGVEAEASCFPSCPTQLIPKTALIPAKRQTNKQHLYLILEGQKKIPEANQVSGL